jgi:hypothetical protein
MTRGSGHHFAVEHMPEWVPPFTFIDAAKFNFRETDFECSKE